MDLFGGFSRGLGGIKTSNKGVSFPKMLDNGDFVWDDSGSPVCVAATWRRIAYYTVGAQQKLALGQGQLGSPAEEKGFAYGLTKDDTGTPVEEPGMYRLYAADPLGSLEMLGEFRSEQLKAGGADFDRQKAMLVTEVKEPLIREDSRLEVWFKSDAADTIVEANSILQIPVTIYKV